MKSARKTEMLAALAVMTLLVATFPARAQSVITTIVGGTIPNPPLANICLPVTAMTLYRGNIYFASCNQVWEETLQGRLTLIAGTGKWGLGGDGGPATSATFNDPEGLAFDSHGNLYVADAHNSSIREINLTTGIIQTVVGATAQTYFGGPTFSVPISNPSGVAIDSMGDIFVSTLDYPPNLYYSGAVLSFTPTGTIGKVAGSNYPVNILGEVLDVAFDGSGNLFFTTQSELSELPVGGGLQPIIGAGPEGNAGNGGQAAGAEVTEPKSVFVNANGNIFIADTGNDCIREINKSSGIIQVVFGNQTDGTATGAAPALNTMLLGPTGVYVDSSGNIFESDSAGIHELVAATGAVAFLAGSPNTGYNSDGIPASNATLFFPQNIAVDAVGNLFIADTFNDRIREVQSTTGTISTVAGDGTAPFLVTGTSVEPWGISIGGPQHLLYFTQHHLVDLAEQTPGPSDIQGIFSLNPTSNSGSISEIIGALSTPNGLALDASGNVFVALTNSFEVAENPVGTSSLQIIAGFFAPTNEVSGLGDGGPATSADIALPEDVLVDKSGNVFIADTEDSRIREVVAATGNIETVAGDGSITTLVGSFIPWGFYGDGGPATSAWLFYPHGIAMDSAGDIFIADTDNNRVREVVAATGIIQTIAGNGTAGFSGDGGLPINAELNHPTGLAFDLQGNLLIVDTYNSRIRKLVMAAPAVTVSSSTLSFTAQTPATTSGAMSITLTNTGNETLSISAAPAISGTNSGEFTIAIGTTCTNGAMLAPAATCLVNVTFTPGAAGNRSATLTISNSATNSSTISLSGVGSDFSVGAQSGGTTSATVTAGQTATYNLQLAPTGFTGTVSLSCSGAPTAATCTVSPTSLTLSGTSAAMFTVSVTTIARSSLIIQPTAPSTPRLFPLILWIGAFASLTLLTLRKRHRLAFAFLAVAFVGLAAAGCGGGSSSTGAGGTTGTPAGASTLTINATSGSVTHSIQVTLNVN